MIEKQELLKIFKEAYYTEERAVLIYRKHLDSAIFWTGISKDKAQKAKELLEKLAKDSFSHKIILEGLISEVKENNKDAF
ncbi:MAG: hypothetical protein JSV34_04205 [Candidatus Omnitrophota bacterium]|nr:MAG: hypothetical protein JSV34_04205 [Candidatus Omnitrophota bacterium]